MYNPFFSVSIYFQYQSVKIVDIRVLKITNGLTLRTNV